MEIKTTISLDTELGGLMTGEERYPVYSSNNNVDKILSEFKGLLLFGGCLDKARIVQKYYPDTVLVAGAIRVISNDYQSMYGYDFHPPLEMHVWLERNSVSVIDFALPGVILRGLQEGDEIGPFLVGREPIIIIDNCPDWVIYKKVCNVILK